MRPHDLEGKSRVEWAKHDPPHWKRKPYPKRSRRERIRTRSMRLAKILKRNMFINKKEDHA